MGRQNVTRRLAAIMVADVVGFSRSMEADESGTLARMKSHRAELVEPRIAAHDGHIVKTMGDGFLAEFPSAVEALACAAEIQRVTAQRNEDLPENMRVEYRVGINLGDVIVEDGDILGHGVNVASRLETMAEPGGVWIGRPVYDQVKGKLELEFEYMGEQHVHNIEEPVRAYRVVRPDASAVPLKATGAAAQANTRSSRRSWLIGGAALIAIAAIGLGVGTAMFRPSPPDARVTEMGAPTELALPNKPSIAVLRFTNMSDDPAQEYFSDGFAEDLITDLSKVSGLFIVARNSSFAYGSSPDINQVAKDLGVRYVMEGSVRGAGGRVRINAQLIDTTTGGHVWADRYDGSLDDIFDFQDQVAAKIVVALAVKLTAGEQERIKRKQTTNPDAYDAFLRGWAQYLRQRPESFREAIVLLKKAIELDPDYSRAYAALAATYWQVWKRYWHTKIGLAINHDARYLAEGYLAKAMNDPTPLALQVATAMFSLQGRHDEAVAEAERAIALDPNDPDSYVALAGAMNLAGRPKEALGLVERAMRLNPHYPPSYLYELGLAQFGMEAFTDAALSLEEATALNPDDRWSFRLLIATYGHLGRTEEAATAMNKADPNARGYDPLSVKGVAFWYPFKDSRAAERLADGLRKAGVPD